MIAATLAFVLVSLLVLAAPIGVAAKGPNITLTADQQTVNAGDPVTLKIKLQNVKNATLNLEALPGGQDQVVKKVFVCATTTYTVEALPNGGGPKISQALTITASGTTTKAACLPDMVAVSVTASQSYDPKFPDREFLHIAYTLANRGQALAKNIPYVLYANGKPLFIDIIQWMTAGQQSAGYWDYDTTEGGSFTYSLVLDRDNTIVESDKTNNTAAANLTVVVGQNPISLLSDKVDKSGQGPNILKLIKP
jgi:hypothetical protein